MDVSDSGPGDPARVSVVIPTYNRADYLVLALESVFGQTVPPGEVIVVDDGSTDHTRRALEPYRDRIRYFRQENAGEPVARNRGIREARGDFVAFLDSDDLWEDRFLEEALRQFEEHPKAGLVTFRRAEIDGEGRPTGIVEGKASAGPWFSTRTLLGRDWRRVGMPVVRRSCLEEVGEFNEELRISPDMEMWLRFSMRWPMREAPGALYLWRRHEGITDTLGLRLWDIRAVDGFALHLAGRAGPALRWRCRSLRARLRRRLVRDWLRHGGPRGAASLDRSDAMRAAREAIRLNPLTLENYLLLNRARRS